MAETLNMMSVTIDEFVGEVEAQLEEENYEPMIGIGKSGVGKTMSIYELTQKLGIGFCELRLVTLTEVDMLGIPDIKVQPDGTKTTTYASNDLLPNAARDGEKGILVLDEITSATSTIRAAAYQLLDSKRALGNYKLPNKWKVIALGNGPDDGGVFQGMESAFLSRAVCYRTEPDIPCWKKWAISHDINPVIPAFISFDNQWFHKMNVDEIASVFPCPRSWTALSKMLNAREKRKGRKLTEGEVTMLAAGAVGVEAATPFATFYSFNNKMDIDPEDIVSGKAVKEAGQIGNRKFSCLIDMSTVEREVIFITIQSVTKILNEKLKGYSVTLPLEQQKQYAQVLANVLKWGLALADVRKDYAVSAFQDITSSIANVTIILTDDIFDEILPEFMTFAMETGNIF